MILLGAVILLTGEHAAALGLPHYAGFVCGLLGGGSLLVADIRLRRAERPDHRHRWAEVSRRFSPATGRSIEGPAGAIDVPELLYGVTVVELRCEECGDVKAVRYAGTAETPELPPNPTPTERTPTR